MRKDRRKAAIVVLIIFLTRNMANYICDVAMDEDDYMRLQLEPHYSCPYYHNGDEYRIVRKQM